VAKTAVKKNAKHVLLLNRPSSRADAAEQEVKRMLSAVKKDDGSPSSSTVVETIPCDLQDFDSVREAARLIKSKYDAIDVLCNKRRYDPNENGRRGVCR
jgi:NAD(P)-dependent dehydrogenase (short-subunit alcohol dehydrogenase family)